jgi:hypothetical protein
MATTYKLEFRLVGSGSWTEPAGDMTLADGEVRQTLTGLTTESDYEFRIVRNSSGVLSVSNAIAARTKTPDPIANGGTISGLGTFTFDDSSNTITRTATSTVINFGAANWATVGIAFNPGAGELKYYVPRVSATLADYTLDSNGIYLQKSGQRSVVVKLAASVAFSILIPNNPNPFTFTVTSV